MNEAYVPVETEPVSDAALLAEETGEEMIGTESSVYHPFLTTPFEDYTVVEGLLLLILLLFFISGCIKMLKEGFSWLLS